MRRLYLQVTELVTDAGCRHDGICAVPFAFVAGDERGALTALDGARVLGWIGRRGISTLLLRELEHRAQERERIR
jgi:hypothetical protein